MDGERAAERGMTSMYRLRNLPNQDRRQGLAEVLLDERADIEVLVGGGVGFEPAEELGDFGGHAAIFGQLGSGGQSRVFAGE